MQLFSVFSIYFKNWNFKHLLKKGTAKMTVPYLQKDLFSFPEFQFYCSNASQRTSCQRIEGSKACRIACFRWLFSCRIILTAVSYTHLDVYKRQDIYSKPGKSGSQNKDHQNIARFIKHGIHGLRHHSRTDQISHNIAKNDSDQDANYCQTPDLLHQHSLQLPCCSSNSFHHAKPADIRGYRNIKYIVDQAVSYTHLDVYKRQG